MAIFPAFYTLLFLLFSGCRASKSLNGILKDMLSISGFISKGCTQMAVRVSQEGLKASRFNLYSGSKTEADQPYCMQYVMPVFEATYFHAFYYLLFTV